MKCPACQSNLEGNGKFCGKCGRKIELCPGCSAPIIAGAKFCGKCGKPTSGGAATEDAPVKEKTQRKLPQTEIDIEPKASVCKRCGGACAEGRTLCAKCVYEQRQKEKFEKERLTEQKKYCAKCGVVVPDGQSLCVRCRNAASDRNVRTDADEYGEKNNKTVVVIAVIAAVIFLVAAIILAIVAFGGKDDETPEEPRDIVSEVAEGQDGFWFFNMDKDADEETVAPEREYFIAETEPVQTMAPETIPETVPPTQPPTEAPTEPEMDEDERRLLYFLENCDSVYLSRSDIEGFDEEMCRLARNGVYAKSGRMFKDSSLQEYYEQFDWYDPHVSPSSFTASMLNEYQNANLNLIMKYEREKGYR